MGLGGCGSGLWGELSCAGQPDPLPCYIPQPMEGTGPAVAAVAAGAAGGEGDMGAAKGDYGRDPLAANAMPCWPGKGKLMHSTIARLRVQ